MDLATKGVPGVWGGSPIGITAGSPYLIACWGCVWACSGCRSWQAGAEASPVPLCKAAAVGGTSPVPSMSSTQCTQQNQKPPTEHRAHRTQVHSLPDPVASRCFAFHTGARTVSFASSADHRLAVRMRSAGIQWLYTHFRAATAAWPLGVSTPPISTCMRMYASSCAHALAGTRARMLKRMCAACVCVHVTMCAVCVCEC